MRVADIVYRLALKTTRLDVETTRGQMQIDEFSTAYDGQDRRCAAATPTRTLATK